MTQFEMTLQRKSRSAHIRPKILVVEDDDGIRKMIEYKLKTYGYEYKSFANGANAYEAIIEEEPTLVILDNFLPGLTGYEMLRRIRKSGMARNTKFLILTASKDPKVVKPLMRLKVSGFIVKPFDMKLLWERIQQILRN